MKVLFIPKWDDANPYQRLLMDALEEEDVETSIKNTYPIFTLLIHSLMNRELDIIHLHWPDPLYLFKYGYDAPYHQRFLTKIATIFRLFLLVLDVELTRLFGPKIVWTVHDKYDHNENHRHVQIIAGWYLTRRVDDIEVKCSSAEDIIRELYRIPESKEVNIIPHGNYIGEYENSVNKKEAREELSIGKDTFVYLYFGSMRAYKGLPELIEVYNTFEKREDSKLLLVGKKRNEGPVISALNRAEDINEIITVTEYVPDVDVQLYFNAADVVVLPFRDILGSGSALLALSFGCPLVVRKKGCVPDIVPEENFLYEGQIIGLQQAMFAAYEAEDLDDISEQNFASAEALDWASIAMETKQMYESI